MWGWLFLGEEMTKNLFFILYKYQNYVITSNKTYFTVESSIVVKYSYFIQCKIWQFYKRKVIRQNVFGWFW